MFERPEDGREATVFLAPVQRLIGGPLPSQLTKSREQKQRWWSCKGLWTPLCVNTEARAIECCTGIGPGVPAPSSAANQRKDLNVLQRKFHFKMCRSYKSLRVRIWNTTETPKGCFKMCSSEVTLLRNDVSLVITVSSTQSVTSSLKT